MTGSMQSASHLLAPPVTAPAGYRGRTRKWPALALAALLAASGGGMWAVRQHQATPAAAAPPPAPTVTVSPPLQRSVARWTDFTGQFSAVDQVDLRAQVSGYLTEIHFTDGQVVHTTSPTSASWQRSSPAPTAQAWIVTCSPASATRQGGHATASWTSSTTRSTAAAAPWSMAVVVGGEARHDSSYRGRPSATSLTRRVCGSNAVIGTTG